MKKKKNIKIIAGVIGALVIIVCVFAFILVRDLKQEDILRVEISNLSKKDFSTDRYNTPLKTHGDYGIVESTIKEYLDDYAQTLQSLPEIAKDEKIKSLLSADNYKNDGPDFKETKNYLNEVKTSFNEKITKLTNMVTENEIMAKIKGKKLDDYYNDLYKELMIQTMGFDAEKLQSTLNDYSSSINDVLNTEEKVIDLLISEKGKWSASDGKIVFQSTDALNKYNELIKDYQNNQ